MSLIQLLQEASTLDIPNLKKAILKDRRAAIIFAKDLTLDKIEDKDAFLSTIKYWILNNESVKKFIELRHNVKDLDKETLAGFRKLRGSELTENQLKWLKEFVADIFKEHNSVSKGIFSADLKCELKDWFNSNGHYFNLPVWAIRELKAIPLIRPDKKVVVYRGVLFSEDSLTARETYNGTLEKGNGLKFLQSIRKGGKEVELDWDRPSSWTTSREVAEQFAKYGPASSSFSATLQWFDRGIKKSKIDGALGYVVSTLVEPDNVLLDTAKLTVNIPMQHGFESEIILAPGKYNCRVVKKYTVEGEVEPVESGQPEKHSIVNSSIESVLQFIETFTFPDEINLINNSDLSNIIWAHTSVKILKYPKVFKQLILNGTTTVAVHAVDKLHKFYNNSLSHLTDNDLRADNFSNNEELRLKASKLKKIISLFNEEVSHLKFKNEKKSSSKDKRYKLNGEEYRSTQDAVDLRQLEKQLLTNGKIVNSEGDGFIENLSKSLGVKLPTTAKLSRFGDAKQLPYINEIISAFFNAVNLDKPEDKTESIKVMINLIRKAYRNYVLLQELKSFKEKFESLK